MFEINCHFLDTNILLSLILPEDNLHKKAVGYFKEEYKRYLSNTVINESQNVIFKLRRIAFKIIKHVKLNILKNSVDLLNIDNFLYKLKMDFIAQYHNNDFPEGIQKQKFVHVVNQFFMDYNEYFKYSIVSNDVNNLNVLAKNIKNDYKFILNNLFGLFTRFICISFINKMSFTKNLINIGINKSDAIILEEFFRLSQSLNESIIFLTLDNDILKLTHKINQIFHSIVSIETLKD
ncbi:MAG: hypothetical protein IJ104_01075 [Methanobrevibacter sp.]|nr:hypothetical protein [Methanobrevibacter sp.]